MITGEVVGVEKANDTHNNLIVWVCFKDEGIEIPFYNGEGLLKFNDIKVWPLYAKYENFMGLTTKERETWVCMNIESQANLIIINKLRDDLNTSTIKNLSSLVGIQVEKETASFQNSKPLSPELVTINLDGDILK